MWIIWFRTRSKFKEPLILSQLFSKEGTKSCRNRLTWYDDRTAWWERPETWPICFTGSPGSRDCYASGDTCGILCWETVDEGSWISWWIHWNNSWSFQETSGVLSQALETLPIWGWPWQGRRRPRWMAGRRGEIYRELGRSQNWQANWSIRWSMGRSWGAAVFQRKQFRGFPGGLWGKASQKGSETSSPDEDALGRGEGWWWLGKAQGTVEAARFSQRSWQKRSWTAVQERTQTEKRQCTRAKGRGAN